MKYYDEFLNTKSTLICENEKDIEQHNLEIIKIYDFLQDNAKAGAIIKVSCLDIACRDNKPEYRFIEPDEYSKIFESLDCKNGIDFIVYKDNLCAVVHGQNYVMAYTDKLCMKETLVDFRFIDENQTEAIDIFSDCCEFLDDTELMQEFLGIVHKKRDFFINPEKLLDSLKIELNQENYSLSDKIMNAANRSSFFSQSEKNRENNMPELS